MGFAKIGISNELLAITLGFPEGTRFLPACPPRFPDVCDFIVEHEDLTGSRCEPPEIKPIHKTTTIGFNWNQKD